MRVLVLNAGSSSLKTSFIDDGRTLVRRADDWGADASRQPDRHAGVEAAIEAVRTRAPGLIDAVGHRVVHGGAEFRTATRIDDGVLAGLHRVAELAPLHNPVAIETIEAARALLPDVPHVAAFDTAFHASLPEAAVRYPVPRGWWDQGIRRYGFHGLSVAWSVRRAAELLDRPADRLRVVVAHLGSGCSATAVDGGRSVATSMGMTPLEGLMMGTRAGSVDPGILLRLLGDGTRTVEELADDLEHASGLVAVAGTSDVAALQARADRGDPDARLALEMFASRAAAGIAAVATALPRLDAVAFTGGIGEHATAVRQAIVGRLASLGVEPTTRADPGAAAAPADDTVLSGAGARVAVLRIESREDLVIAREVEQVLRLP